eukprot:622622-Pyramimonas_sp.AAC.2
MAGMVSTRSRKSRVVRFRKAHCAPHRTHTSGSAESPSARYQSTHRPRAPHGRLPCIWHMAYEHLSCAPHGLQVDAATRCARRTGGSRPRVPSPSGYCRRVGDTKALRASGY